MLIRSLVRCVLCTVSLLAGCASSVGDNSSTLPDAAKRRATAARAVAVAESEAGAELTYVMAMDADSRGRVYVADMLQPSVLVLSPEGRVLRRIGRSGSGPGEFRSLRDVQVLPGDSLLVYDPQLVRVSVFAPDSAHPAYVVNLAERLRGMPPFHLRRAPATGLYLATFQARFAFGTNNEIEPRRDSLVLLGPDGAPRTVLATFAAAPFLVAGTSVTPHPFGRSAVAQLDSKGRTLFVWTDSLAATVFSPAGERAGAFGYRYEPPPVTRDDQARALEAMGEQGKQMFERVIGDSVPPRWPAVADLRVDDGDRIWMSLAGPLDQPVEWTVYSPSGRYLHSVFFPAGTTLHAVRSGRAYTQRVDSSAVAHVAVFEVRPQP